MHQVPGAERQELDAYGSAAIQLWRVVPGNNFQPLKRGLTIFPGA